MAAASGRGVASLLLPAPVDALPLVRPADSKSRFCRRLCGSSLEHRTCQPSAWLRKGRLSPCVWTCMGHLPDVHVAESAEREAASPCVEQHGALLPIKSRAEDTISKEHVVRGWPHGSSEAIWLSDCQERRVK